MSSEISYVPGRSCEGCTLCCRVLGIVELKKPAQIECPHADVNRACRIYATRPQSCRAFHCAYLLTPLVPDHWKPALCHMVLRIELDTSRVTVHVDANHRHVWRKEPYYSDIKRWATQNAIQAGWIVVYEGDDAIVVSANRDQNVGPVGPHQVINIYQVFDESGQPSLNGVVLDKIHTAL